MIICIGSDGKVAQTGTYRDLSRDKEGAFAKLMEWQMSGGTSASPVRPERREVDPELSEEERRKMREAEEEEREREAEVQRLEEQQLEVKVEKK